jgi:hypothetical protein
MDSGHCALPFGTATGAFFICTHHDASLAYLAGLEPIFASGTVKHPAYDRCSHCSLSGSK